jgi:hypothetical protein
MVMTLPPPNPTGRIPDTSELCPPEPEIVVCDCGGSCWWDDTAELWTCALCPLTYEPDDDPHLEYEPEPDDEPDDDPRSPRRVQTMKQLATTTKARGWWRWG